MGQAAACSQEAGAGGVGTEHEGADRDGVTCIAARKVVMGGRGRRAAENLSAARHPCLIPACTLHRRPTLCLLQGPSAKEVNRDSTAFERARAEWSKATVSHRGKVGGGGDAKAQNWLG